MGCAKLIFGYYILIKARGDMFPVFPEDEDEDNSTKMSTLPIDRNTNLVPTFPSTIKPLTSAFTTTLAELEANADLCSKMAFNAFMQLKNGSIYAFRGKWHHWEHDFTLLCWRQYNFICFFRICCACVFIDTLYRYLNKLLFMAVVMKCFCQQENISLSWSRSQQKQLIRD